MHPHSLLQNIPAEAQFVFCIQVSFHTCVHLTLSSDRESRTKAWGSYSFSPFVSSLCVCRCVCMCCAGCCFSGAIWFRCFVWRQDLSLVSSPANQVCACLHHPALGLGLQISALLSFKKHLFPGDLTHIMHLDNVHPHLSPEPNK